MTPEVGNTCWTEVPKSANGAPIGSREGTETIPWLSLFEDPDAAYAFVKSICLLTHTTVSLVPSARANGQVPFRLSFSFRPERRRMGQG